MPPSLACGHHRAAGAARQRPRRKYRPADLPLPCTSAAAPHGRWMAP